MLNFLEYSDSYTKTSGSLYQYARAVSNKDVASPISFQLKNKMTPSASVTNNTKDITINIPIKYLSNF